MGGYVSHNNTPLKVKDWNQKDSYILGLAQYIGILSFFFISNLFNDYDINSIGVIFGLGIIRIYGVTNNRVQ